MIIHLSGFIKHAVINKIKNFKNKKKIQLLLNYLKRYQDKPFDLFSDNQSFFWKISEKSWLNFSCYFNASNRTLKLKNADIIYRWGMSKLYKIVPHLKTKKIYLVEDGFLRSLTTAADNSSGERSKISVGFVVDDLAPHFCATHISRLEQRIKNTKLNETEKDKASRLISYIVDNNLTKYNHQPCYTPDILKTPKHKILIIDQAFGDFSIIIGGNGKKKDFERMLKDALLENPNSLILVKVHPDVLAGKYRFKGYFNTKNTHSPVILFAENINPIYLLKAVDKVYVWSSGMGFEALMLNKEVVTYGTPFYAGWGLSVDRHPIFKTQDLQNRRNTYKTKEDLFHAAYVWYTHYVNPDTLKACSIEEALKWLKDNRDKAKE